MKDVVKKIARKAVRLLLQAVYEILIGVILLIISKHI